MCEVHMLVALSTAHLRPKTAELMEVGRGAGFPFIVAPFEEGFFVSCVSVEPEAPPNEADLWECRRWAQQKGWRYILFDRDAETVPDLPDYEW